MVETCGHPLVQLISELSGGLSFIIWLVAQLPQTIEIYQNKSVEGLSPLFLSFWFIGDLTGFIGCILTNQLLFQNVIATYFLLNDFILLGQYYYYKNIYHKFHHHHHHHKRNSTTRRSTASVVVPATILVASNIQSSTAFPIPSNISSEFVSLGVNSQTIGTISAWIGAGCYFFARIPQLYKNYQRKSTQDISPFLFGCTLIGNLTYAISILVSCEFLYSSNAWEFFMNELPYMIGSAGTIIFDVFYFYQVWIYRDQVDDKFRDEERPLLTSD